VKKNILYAYLPPELSKSAAAWRLTSGGAAGRAGYSPVLFDAKASGSSLRHAA